MTRSIRDFGFRTMSHKPTEYVRRRRTSRPTVEGLETRALLTTLVGLGNANNLLTFDSATPGTIQGTFALSGVPVGVSIKSIASRPATGALLALGDDSRLYSLDITTGNVTAISTSPFSPSLIGSQFAISTNPITDTVRVITNSGQNFRVNPSNGIAISPADPLLSYATGDPNAGAPEVVALAYTNNTFGLTSTTAYVIDAASGTLDRLGSPGGTPVSPNESKLSTVGSLGVTIADTVGFTIVGSNNIAYAAMTAVGSTPALYTINLATGAATKIGTIDGGTATIIGLAAIAPPTPSAPILAAASDSGVSNSDHITNVTTPVIQGTALPNANILVLANGVNVGTGTANSAGQYSITIGPPLSDGSYTVQVVQSDGSGLFSGASAPLSPALVIKASIPAPGIPNLFSGSDTGYSSTDHYTRINTPAFFGTGQVGDTIQIFANGQPIPIAQGPVQVVGQYALQSVPLPDGIYLITASQTDSAGNTSAMSAPMTPLLVIDNSNRPTPADSFINQLYLNLLNRPADKGAFDLLAPLVTGPEGRLRAVQTILGFEEYRRQVVRSAYQTLLHRDPEPSALTIGANYLTNHTDGQLRAILAGSSEYYSLHGGTNTSYLSAVYLDILGRPIDSAGMTKYLAFLNAGVAPQTVVFTIIQSQEGFSTTATRLYQTYLKRNPDSNSLTNMVNILSSSGRDEDLIQILASSQEYFLNAQASQLDVNQWAMQVHLDLLGRPPDATVVAAVKKLLNESVSTTQVAQSLQQSNEYRAVLVNQVYQTILRRAPDPAGLNAGIAFLNAGGNYQGLEVILYGSQEYFLRIGGGSNAGYLTAIYEDILGRPIDSGASVAGLAALNGGFSREALASFLVNGSEGSARLVQQTYLTFLRRLPSFSESTSDARSLSNGTRSYTDLIAILVGSQEYFAGL